ncbi:ROK family protein [Brotaphodocola catenula]|uniref:fructokinase n=1 Tax=Brotaphodocola catenula TaxID=2885361 RepID=A0AAE3DKF8_9FIRM|nr:ROK family protein [Brotaphodocola catenula]MCC2165167.1 ROK family protein [Brotaphodocola catenula]
MLFGALEAGGTKMVCAIGNENGEILEQKSIRTTTPEETMPAILEYFKDKEIASIGIACFGPIDLNKNSETYGYITSTPKIPWRNYNIVGAVKDALKIPVGFDTDVNGSLLGEVTWGCAKGLTDAVYFTIGTGVGAGIMTNGKMLHGMLHPEAGHVKMVPRSGDTYKGKCPYHGTCFEGMAAGPAIEERWGAKAVQLADREEVWDLESYYIAQALMGIVLTLSPQKIILGGGVMHQKQLFSMIREKMLKELNGYIQAKELTDIDNYIVPASLNDDQGIMGCIKLAMNSLEEENK